MMENAQIDGSMPLPSVSIVKSGSASCRQSCDPRPNLSFEELLQAIDAMLDKKDGVVEEMTELLESYISKRSDWKKYAHFDPCRYTRNLVLESTEKFNLILLCWGEGQASGVHDHANSDCFVKILDGELEETRYKWPTKEEESLEKSEILRAKKNDVMYMNDSIGLHRVANPSHSQTAVSLHLYSPPFMECGSYCERTGKCHKARMTWHSKCGKRVDSCLGIRKKMGIS